MPTTTSSDRPADSSPTDHVNRMNTPFTDAADLVARSELATNQYDPYWQMSMYAKTIRLEIIGDGVHDIQDGIEDGSGAVVFAARRCPAEIRLSP